VIMVDEQTKIWAAGFFDGEGGLTINLPTKGNNSYILHTSINNTVKESVEIFFLNWGGSLHKEGHGAGTFDKRGIKSNRQAWQVIFDEDEAYRLIIDLLPYVRTKKPQFEFAKEFIEKVKNLRSLRSGRGKGGGKQTGIEQQYRKEAYQIMKRLNEGENLQDISMPISNTIIIPKLF